MTCRREPLDTRQSMPNGPSSTIEQIPGQRAIPPSIFLAHKWLDLSGKFGLEQTGKLKLFFLINGFLLLWLILRPARPETITAVDDAVCVFAPCLAALWCFIHFFTAPSGSS